MRGSLPSTLPWSNDDALTTLWGKKYSKPVTAKNLKVIGNNHVRKPFNHWIILSTTAMCCDRLLLQLLLWRWWLFFCLCHGHTLHLATFTAIWASSCFATRALWPGLHGQSEHLKRFVGEKCAVSSCQRIFLNAPECTVIGVKSFWSWGSQQAFLVIPSWCSAPSTTANPTLAIHTVLRCVSLEESP